MRNIIIAIALLLGPALCLADMPTGAVSRELTVSCTVVSPDQLAQLNAEAADLLEHMSRDAAQDGSRTTFYPSAEGLIQVMWTGYAVAYVRSAALCGAINQRAPAGASETNAPKAVCDEGSGGSYTVYYVDPAAAAAR